MTEPIAGRAVFASLILIAAVALLAPSTVAQTASNHPYAPAVSLSGTIRIWGDTTLTQVMSALENAFSSRQPNVHFDTHLMGTGSAMAGLYTGVADLALMGRASTSKEVMAFEWVFHYKPAELEVMTGALVGAGRSPALAVFVHKDNPLSMLTLPQLDAILSCEPPRGLVSIRTWGELGIFGSWRDKPIHAYTFDTETGTGRFLRQTVLDDNRKWAWDRVREFKEANSINGSPDDASRQILGALSQDRYGIAIATLGHSNPSLKAVALASTSAGPFYDASRQTLIERNYPLTRSIFVYFNHAPGKPADRKLAEFLRFMLSDDGQNIINGEGDFLPLSRAMVEQGIQKLK